MQLSLVALTWLFTFTIVFTQLTTSVHGKIFPPGYLLGDIAINCGCVSNSTALDGRHWVGETPLLRPTNGKSTSSILAHKLLSADPTPYLTARLSFSYFSYLFQVNPGQKFIRFHFYPETYQGFEYSQDFFTVEANSFTLLHNFSASLATHALGVKYVVKEYCLYVNETGILQISFFSLERSRKSNKFFAFVNGIEIISMPNDLYHTPENSLGPRIVGQSNRFHYIDNSTALELVQRLNVGGGSISPVEDTGMFRRWTEDVDYLLESSFKQINHWFPTNEYTISSPFIAPPKIYQTSRKLRKNLPLEDQFTWKIPVDAGFSYLLRLHFSFVEIEFLEGGAKVFNILVQNHVVEGQINVIQLSGGKRTPLYRDYLVMVKGDRARGKRDLCVSLQSFDELVLGLLNGLEIFKLSNSEDSLASPNPSGLRHTSSSWTLKIHSVFVASGQSNIIITALTIIFVLVNSIVYQLRRINGYTFRQKRSMESSPDEPAFRQFSLIEILSATQDFNESLVIGKGGFGKVYKGFIYGCPEILAIKRLKPDSTQGAREFWREIETLSKLRHVHLVSLLGYCKEREEMIIVYEYMPRGTIADNLYKSGRDGKERIPFTWEQRLRICIGAARGLDYLHTGTQYGIIHRDVKDTNILLDENLVAKISDFGLSKLGKIGETHGEHSTKVKGTIGYMDPDYIMTHKPSTKSDVYAFGIVLLVVLSGRPALERRFFEETKSLLDCYRECVTKGEMDEIIDPFLQGEILIESLTSFMEAVGNCLHRRPKKRPTMAQLVVQLEHALEKQLGSVPSMYGDDTVVGQNSRTRSNLPFEFYEFQFAPSPKESIISLPREGNNANREIQKGETRVDKGKDHKITQKPLWGRPLASLWNILKPSKKTYPGLLPTNVFGEWKHQIPIFSLKDIKLATEDFSVKNIIGKGGYGTMYKGFINDGAEIVAIKRFGSSAFKGDKQFQTEVELLSTIHHIHLVRLVGLCYERNDLIVVYEYMSHGTLKDHLYGNLNSRNGQTCLTWEQRLKICIGAALGLTYLHEAGFIHRDVKVENIMLHEENFVAKISDFGLSKRISLAEESETHVSTRVVGTLGYMDPSYALAGRLSKKSDVYSFGIVLLVVLSGTPAFDSSRPEKHLFVKDWYETCSREGNFDGLIDPKLVGGIPLGSLGSFLELIKICLNEQPKRRPVMAQVVVNLERSLDLLDKEKEDQSADTSSKTAEQIKRRVEIARLWELDMLKGDVESEMKPKGRDIDTMHHNYTV